MTIGPSAFVSMLRIFSIALTFVSFTAAQADEVDECIARKQKDFESPQPFEQRGEITCAAADIVGIPPRIRTHDENGAVSYKAPPGFVIKNQSISSIKIENVSQNHGSFGSPSLTSDGAGVVVPIACAGRGVGEGRAWQEVVVRGFIARVPTTEQIKEWAKECVKCVALQSCATQ